MDIDIARAKSTLRDISKDDNGNCVVQSQQECYNFDLLSELVANKYRKGKKTTSVDGLIVKENIYLIEFKNTRKGHMPKKELFYKAYDSLYTLQLLGYKNLSINDLAKITTYIVVYNDNAVGQKEQKSDSMEQMKQKLKELSKVGTDYPIHFKLDIYKPEIFKEIYTVDKMVFETDVINKII